MAVIPNKCLLIGGLSILLTACATPPQPSSPTVRQTPPVEVTPQTYTTPTGVTITPYDIQPITRKSL